MTGADDDGSNADDDEGSSDGYVHTPNDEGSSDGYVHTPDDGVDDDRGRTFGPGTGDTTASTDDGDITEQDDDGPTARNSRGTISRDASTASRDDAAGTDGPETIRSPHPDAVDREFDWRGWTLVAVLGVAFVVAPLTIYLIPPSSEQYFTVLVVMPLLPALLLAAVAVWATTRP